MRLLLLLLPEMPPPTLRLLIKGVASSEGGDGISGISALLTLCLFGRMICCLLLPVLPFVRVEL